MINEVTKRFISLFEMLELNNVITSRADASRKLDYKPQAFTEVLKERSNVSIDLIQKFCIEYGVNLDYLILGKGPFFKDKNLKLNARSKNIDESIHAKKNTNLNTNLNTNPSSQNIPSSESDSFKQPVNEPPPECPKCLEKDKTIEALQQTVRTQADYIDLLKEKIDMLTGKPDCEQKRKAG